MSYKLKKDFYNRNVLIVAKELLGKYLVYESKDADQKLVGKIVETEAYDGSVDEAAHTFRGKTERNKIMFEEGGYLYVYFTYGVHYCSNIVTGKREEGNAVLLRAMEPIEGIKYFATNRFGKNLVSEKEKINLLNGPAKICQAFGVNKTQNGTYLLDNKIYLLDAPKIEKSNIITTTRIGISKSVDLPWRFYIKDNPYISKK